jgi:hypothetical protein
MPESDGLRLGKAAVSRIFRDEAKLTEFLKQTRGLGIKLETCQFGQVEAVIRELCPPAGATAVGRPLVVTYQGLPENEDQILAEFFRRQLSEAKTKYPDLFK